MEKIKCKNCWMYTIYLKFYEFVEREIIPKCQANIDISSTGAIYSNGIAEYSNAFQRWKYLMILFKLQYI